MKVTSILVFGLLAIAVMAVLCPAEAQAPAGDTDRLVTIRLQDTPIKSAVAMLFQAANKTNYGFEAGVQGTVTLNLKDVPFDNALSALLRTAGLTMRKDSEIYMIGPKKETTAEVAAPVEWAVDVEPELETSKAVRKIQIGFIDVADLADIFGVQMISSRANTMGGMGGGMGGYGGGMMGGGGYGGGMMGGMGGGYGSGMGGGGYGGGGYGGGGYGGGGYGGGGYGGGGYGGGGYGGGGYGGGYR